MKRLVSGGLVALCFAACANTSTYAVHFKRHPDTPGNASVIIDEEYVGPLAYVATRGIRVAAGEHRVTIEKDGYFPYDELVEAEHGTIKLDVELVPIPD
jgi:hypothetical protein